MSEAGSWSHHQRWKARQWDAVAVPRDPVTVYITDGGTAGGTASPVLPGDGSQYVWCRVGGSAGPLAVARTHDTSLVAGDLRHAYWEQDRPPAVLRIPGREIVVEMAALYTNDAFGVGTRNIVMIPLDGSPAVSLGDPGFAPSTILAYGGWAYAFQRDVTLKNLAFRDAAGPWTSVTLPTVKTTGDFSPLQIAIFNGTAHVVTEEPDGVTWKLWRVDPPSTTLTLVSSLVVASTDVLSSTETAPDPAGPNLYLGYADAAFDSYVRKWDGASWSILSMPDVTSSILKTDGVKLYYESGFDKKVYSSPGTDGNTWTLLYTGTGPNPNSEFTADATTTGTIYHIEDRFAPVGTAILHYGTGGTGRSFLNRISSGVYQLLVGTCRVGEVIGVAVVDDLPYLAMRDDPAAPANSTPPEGVFRWDDASNSIVTIWTATNGPTGLWKGERI